jgi:hypothetical protein
MKIKILYNPDLWSNLTTNFLWPIWNQYFECISIDATKTYDPKTHLVYSDFYTANSWIQPWRDRGFRVIVDHVWDSWIQDHWVSEKDLLVLRSDNFIWFNESLWYLFLGYDKIIFNPIAGKSFLMLINKPHIHRDHIQNKLKPILSDAIWSYHGRGIGLQNGDDISTIDPQWQRYVNPGWYNNTKFSVVVETTTDKAHTSPSEKTYKTLAFRHPAIVWGAPGMLEFLHSQGFATFDHIIDESYDKILDYDLRLNKISAEIIRLSQQGLDYFTDTVTKEKLEHNYNLFYSKELVLAKFKQEMIDPMVEFYESSTTI